MAWMFSIESLRHTEMNQESPIDKLKKIFGEIHYGWRNPKTGKPFQNKAEFEGHSVEDVWRLGTPEQTIKAECGNCYDTVAISREYLSKTTIQFRYFFMTTSNSKFDGKNVTEVPTHTFLIYKDSDENWKWLEGSWGPFKNNKFSSKSAEELVKLIATAMADGEKQSITVFELSSYPKYGCDMVEFEGFCRKGKQVGKFLPEKK